MKKKILFVAPSLNGGGSERVFLTLMKHFGRESFHIHLALINATGSYSIEIPYDVVLHDLGVKRVRASLKPIIKVVWKVKPDVILSTLGHLNVFILAFKWLMPRATKLIVRESNTVSEENKNKKYPTIWNFLYTFYYKKADKVICQSMEMKVDLRNNFQIPSDRLIQVYNPVDVTYIESRIMDENTPFPDVKQGLNIVAIGRLSKQKGFTRLIHSMPRLLAANPHAILWILGEGELEAQLMGLAGDLDVAEHIRFVGFQENPYVWLKHADLFVLASDYEGLPNVLLEAIACECPVLVRKHPGGTKEIMEKTAQGHRYVDELHYDRFLFEKDTVNSKKLLMKHFGIDKIVAEYESIVGRVIGSR